jgi:hypothetical protein
MIPRMANIQNGNQGSSLTGGGQQRSDAALQNRDFLFDGVNGGIADSGVKKAVRLQVENFAELLRAVVLKSCALNNREDS